MAQKNKNINPGGVTGTGEGIVNINSKDYKGLQKAILEHAGQQTPKQKIKYALLSLKYQMESYASEQNPGRLIRSGTFLKAHLDAIGIKNKEFAKYIDIKESNLSAILKGRRKINIDLAYKLGQIFNHNPDLWLLIQSKNELMEIDTERKLNYQKYKLEDLLKKVS